MNQTLKNVANRLAALTLPPVLLLAAFVLLAVRPSWPGAAGLAIAAVVYVATNTAHLVQLVRDLETLRTKLTKHSNRLGD